MNIIIAILDTINLSYLSRTCCVGLVTRRWFGIGIIVLNILSFLSKTMICLFFIFHLCHESIHRFDTWKLDMIGWESWLLWWVNLRLKLITDFTFFKRHRYFVRWRLLWEVKLVQLLNRSQRHSFSFPLMRRGWIILIVEFGRLIISITFTRSCITAHTIRKLIRILVGAKERVVGKV